MINIVLPIAGRGSRFQKEGYDLPKPLISVHGLPMIEVVVRNIRPNLPHRFIFIAQQEHLDFLGMRETLNRIAPNCVIIPVNKITDGAACTVLLARDFINDNHQLMIANSDQWVDIDINDYLSRFETSSYDGFIMTMKANDPKWSYVEFNQVGNIIKIVEKEVVSDEATVGIYNFKHGSDFVSSAEEMIRKNLRVNGEFYVAPAYNFLIDKGKKLGIYNIGSEYNGMYGLGIPDDLNKFLKNPLSLVATKD